MAAVVTQQPSDHAYASHRTQAMPKNSLFGTSLEIQDEKDKQQAEGQSDEKKKSDTKREEVPPHLKSLVSSNDRVIRKRLEFERQKEIVRQRQEDLKSVEEKALAFDPDPKTTARGSRPAGSRSQQVDKTHQWFTKKDIDHVEEINVGGLSSSGSFNRDKYGRRPPVHVYSQMGDLLQPGMEFTPRQRTDLNENSISNGKPRLRTNLTNDMEMPVFRSQPPPHSVIALPPNIRHRFGSKICDELLSDERKVADTISRQEKVRFPPRRERRAKTPELEKNNNPEYNGLSNATRQNVFPGCTTGNKQSITKTVYNDSVYDQRHPDPDEYRYQRDELSKWAEHNVLRERMKKAWDLNKEVGEKKN